MDTYCVACGMPLTKKEDVGATTGEGSFCKFCVKADGSVKSCSEVFEGGVQFFLHTFPDKDRAFAERITRKNMKRLSYWQGKDDPCLRGEEATDEEFQETLKKMDE